MAGFFGARAGEAVPAVRGVSPTTIRGSLAGVHAISEQYRAQADQATQALFSSVFSSAYGTKGSGGNGSGKTNGQQSNKKK